MRAATQSSEEDWNRLKERLDAHHDWPGPYTFKFILPRDAFGRVFRTMGSRNFSTRDSANGRYVSMTYVIEATSSDEVIRIYRSVTGIAGVIAL